MKESDGIRKLALLESATLIGIVSTLLTWFVSRVVGVRCPFVHEFGSCPSTIVYRGYPLTWATEFHWMRCRPGWIFVCPPIVEPRVEWFGLVADLVFWTFLFVLLLILLTHRYQSHGTDTMTGLQSIR
jgi:hypothetical protein